MWRYPRVCGGEPLTSKQKEFARQVIPACAGVSRGRRCGGGPTNRYPRVCGGEPPEWGGGLGMWELSPHVRG